MAANDLTFEQIVTVLNSIAQQATGQAQLTATNTSDFITVAQTTLKAGADPIMNAISQTLSKTIFSIRPYFERFQGLRVDSVRWGNHVRKLSSVDRPFIQADKWNLTDGTTVDPFVIRQPEVLQTNFYGTDTYADELTVFDDQLDNAFKGPDEFGSFISMIMGNITDKHAQAREALARACIANLIGGKVAGDSGNVIHLLTEYNTLTGLTLTATTVYQPANFAPFMQWVDSRIAEMSSKLTERTTKYHINVTGKPIARHTPMERQKVFMYAPARYQIDARVLADTYHDTFLRFAADETVNFWQAIDDPAAVNVKATYMASNGTLTTPQSATKTDNIFAVLMDEETAGYTTIHEKMGSIYNPRGEYSNIFWSFDLRYWNDFTENCVVFLLD